MQSVSRTHRHYFNYAAVILSGFLTALLIGTCLLMLPISTVQVGGLPPLPALFTATSALCVTGLTIVDTATYWSAFGKVVILALIQVGGFGVMSFAAVLAQAVIRKENHSTKLASAAERRSNTGQLGMILRRVLGISLLVELIAAILLTFRFLTLEYSFPRALWHGLFHAVSAFNNAGFSLYSDSMTSFVGDWWLCLPIMVAIIIGGLGFPVIFQLRTSFLKPYSWSLHTRMVLAGTAGLLLFSSLIVTVSEWGNPKTLGKLPAADALLAGIFQAVQTRTTGFNSVDIGQMYDSTLLTMDMFMFIGAGPAGTAGGIKITTMFALLAIVAAVIRGRRQVVVFGKSISFEVVYQAVTVVVLAFILVATATIAILFLTDFNLSQVLFEVTSAFGTVGLSTGITPLLNYPAQFILIVLMIIGRLGPITVATALAFAPSASNISFPVERPIIG